MNNRYRPANRSAASVQGFVHCGITVIIIILFACSVIAAACRRHALQAVSWVTKHNPRSVTAIQKMFARCLCPCAAKNCNPCHSALHCHLSISFEERVCTHSGLIMNPCSVGSCISNTCCLQACIPAVCRVHLGVY